ncbi:MAG: response regulator [Myxococcota bacterium]
MTTILVVDDSRSARMIFVRCLKIAGYAEAEFLEAADGREAIERVRDRGDLELAMIDLNMPTMDGLALITALRSMKATKGLAIIVASSLINDATRRRLEEVGVDAVIEKPIGPAALVAALERMGRRRESGGWSSMG